MLPGAANGGGMEVHGSLAALNRLDGTTDQTRFDVWFEARYLGIQAGQTKGSLVIGSLGADYLVTPNLLVGGFVSLDNARLTARNGAASVSGTGWLVGAYATGRLGQNVYLDGLVAGGASKNKISPFGTYTDTVGTTRFLASATVTGEFKSGSWTFSPRSRVAYFNERSGTYIDSLGVPIPSVANAIFDLSAGPGFSYRIETENGTLIEPGIRFDAVARIVSSSVSGSTTSFHGRVEPRLDIRMPGGATLGIVGNYEFGRNQQSYGGSIKLSIGLN